MAGARDWTPYEDAGLIPSTEPEATGRRALLELLIEQGCGIDEMIEAHRRGRLFALVGDRIVRPGARALTFAEVAERAGSTDPTVRRIWRAMGLPGWDSDDGIASEADAEAIAVLAELVPIFDEERVLAHARAVGASLSRIAEATNAIGRTLTADGSLTTSGSEVETARYWEALAPYIPALGRVLDVFSRHHFELARDHFERTGSYDLMLRSLTRAAVGFVDMSGFTAATERLGEIEFARLMTAFATQVEQTVQELGGRVVKFVGDAAMIVAPDADVLATITSELVAGWVESSDGLTLHAGLAYGELLCQDGDYFGSPVNIAARLAALAGPGAILATSTFGDGLDPDRWAIERLDPQPVRGIADPVATCLVRPRA